MSGALPLHRAGSTLSSTRSITCHRLHAKRATQAETTETPADTPPKPRRTRKAAEPAPGSTASNGRRNKKTAEPGSPSTPSNGRRSKKTAEPAASSPAVTREQGTEQGSASTVAQQAQNPRFNYIPWSRWPKGIPPVMGGHLMASGEPSPLSTSAGACSVL